MTRPGWPDSVDGAPTPVEQVVDLDSWTVTLDLHKTSILTQFATAVRDDAGVRADFATLVDGQANGADVTRALDRLRRNWRVRDAFTITWAPVQVDEVIVDLAAANVEPDQCATEHCEWLSQPGTNQCAECLAAADDEATVNVDEGRVA